MHQYAALLLYLAHRLPQFHIDSFGKSLQRSFWIQFSEKTASYQAVFWWSRCQNWGTLTSTIRTAAALHGSTWQDPSHLATSPQLPTLKARRTWELNELFSSMLPDGGVQKIVNKIRSCGWRLQIAGSITKRVCMRWLCWLEWPWTLLHLGSNVGHNRNIE